MRRDKEEQQIDLKKPVERIEGNDFQNVLNEMAKLHDKKAADYGQSTDSYANLRGGEKFGIKPWVGAALLASFKIQRIQSFCKNGKLENESVEDSLLDLANYAAIALVLYREQELARLQEEQKPGI